MKSDEKKLQEIGEGLQSLKRKVPKNLSGVWDRVLLLYHMVGDTLSGKYSGSISYSMIAQIIAVLLYLVLPFDVIFDGLPVVGYSDDLLLILALLDRMGSELDSYSEWKESKG